MRKFSIIFFLFLTFPAGLSAQIVTSGADPVSIKWKEMESENFRIVYPEETDSLAREYLRSLESFAAATRPTIGFSPNELYRRKMPVILHAYSATSNGMVTWAPRRMELFANPDFYNPESTPWITQLAVHEGRHVAQMQFPRASRVFKPLEYFI